MRKMIFYRQAALAFAGLAILGNAIPGLAAPGRGHGKRHAPSAAAQRRAGVAPLPAGVEKPSREVNLSIGEGQIVNLPAGVTSVWTSNPAAADVYVNNNHQIHLFGKSFGESTVFATAASGAVVYAAQVRVAQNITSLDAMLKAAFPDDDIHVTMAGQLAVLTGTVATPMDSTQAEGLVKSALNPGANVSDATTTLKFAVINRLRTATPLQVMLRVRIAEVDRNYTKTLQSNLATATANASNGFKWGLGQGTASTNTGQFTTSMLGVGTTPTTIGMTGATVNSAGQVVPTMGIVPGININVPSTGSALGLAGKLFGLDIIAALNAGEQAGLVTTLAEPTLTAISGETATFLAGGQYPIPTPQAGGTGTMITITYQNYGVSLSYTPTVLADGNISLRVRPEVSELNTSGAVQLNGYTVPGLTIRRAETTVELGSGQSFMIAGLLQNTANNTIQKLPGAGDVPVLGNLFKSTNFQKGETELVIIVTPFLVKPVNDRDIKLPTDGYQNPTDAQRLLSNMFSNGKSGAQRPEPTSTATAAPGFTSN